MKNFLSAFSAPVSAGLFGAAIFTLTWRVSFASPPVKLFEGLIILLALWQGLVFFFGGGPSPAGRAVASRVMAATGLWWSLLLLGALLGLFASVFAGLPWRGYGLDVVLEYGRLLFSVGLFFLVVYVTASLGSIERWLKVIVLAAVPLWASARPSWYGVFFEGDFRLRGPGSDPNYMGSWLALGVVIAVSFWLARRNRALAALGMFGVTSLLLWTISRAGLLSAFVGVTTIFILHLLYGERAGRWRRMAGASALLLAGLLFGFLAAPLPTSSSIAQRLILPFLNGSAREAVFLNPSLGEIARQAGALSWPAGGNGGPSDGRLDLWRRGALLAATHPLGFGPAYYHWQPLGFSAEGMSLGSHNLFLETVLTAGWLGLIGLGGLLWFLARQAALLARRPEGAAFIGCLVVLLVTSIFLDTLTLRWLWLMAGLAVVAASSPEGVSS